MSLRFKPHSLSVCTATDNVDSTTKRVKGETLAAAVTVRGQLTPMSPLTAYQHWGADCKRPQLFLCGVVDVVRFTLSTRCTLGTRKFEVRATQVFDVNLPADHGEVLLEEVNN